ncbi:MAG: alpha-(1-_3)-arabinofuranosyltransferase family protein [Candidatus Dojkabacteria bacterium]|nr:MAG: alpha-(1->3)-arabinofuranosyltransferase family protein [Candidatus Dojkabacteria bacterium]
MSNIKDRVVKIIKNPTLQAFLIFFGISLGIHLIALQGRFDGIINGGDIDYPIDPLLELKRGLSVWSNEALGVPEYFPLSKIFLTLPQFLILQVVRSDYWTNYIYFTLLLALSGFFMYLLLKKLGFKRHALWIGALYFMLNTFVFLRFQFPQPHLRYAYMALPLLVYIAVRVSDKSMKLYTGIGIFALIMMAISRTANMYLLYWLLVPLIVYLLAYVRLVKIKVKFTSLLLFYGLSLALNAVVLFSYLGMQLSYADISQNSVLEFYREDAIRFAADYKIHEVIGGFGSYAWTHNLSKIFPGDHNFTVLAYVSRTVLWVLAIIPVVYALITNFRGRRIALVVVAIIFAILATSYGQPFGEIYADTLGKLPIYSDFFRDSWTYWSMPLFFILSIMLAFSFKDKLSLSHLKKMDKNFASSFIKYQVILVMIVGFVVMYISPGYAINPAWVNAIPYGYRETAQYLNENAKGERVLPLPLSKHIYGYTYYEWGYAGPDIMRRMADVGYTDKYFNQIATNKTVSMLEGIIEPQPETLNEFLYRTQTNWILLRKDFVDLPHEYSNERALQFEEILNNFECWQKVSEYEKLSLYENKCGDHAKSDIQVSKNYVYGDSKCYQGIPLDQYYEDSSVCGSNPKNDNFEIERDLLRINNENETTRLDLEDGEYDLLENYDFKNGLWNEGDLYTCDPDDSEALRIETSERRAGGVTIESDGQKVCIFEPIINENIGSGAMLKIKYKSNNSDPMRYCIFGLTDDYCYILGNMDEKDREGIIVKGENEGDFNVDYLYIDNLASYSEKEDMYLYMYFNDSRTRDFNIEIDELRFISTPAQFADQFEPSDVYDEDSIGSVKVSERLGGSLKVWNSDANGDVLVSFNQRYDDQWLLLGWNKEFMPKVVVADHVESYQYANGWLVKSVEKYDRLGIVYIPQLVYAAGILITAWIYLMYVGISVWGKLGSKKVKLT